MFLFSCYFDRASSLICGNKMPARCNRDFYCRSYCLLNMFRASLCPSSRAQEYYTEVAACGNSCCGFSSCWSGVELRVMCLVCRMLSYCLLNMFRAPLCPSLGAQEYYTVVAACAILCVLKIPHAATTV